MTPQVKHAIVSILIGATVAFVTTLLEGSLHWLQNLDPALWGGLAGTVKHLSKWKTHLIA